MTSFEGGTSVLGRGAGRAQRAAVALLATVGLLTLSVVWAPSASAAPRLTVSATTGLTNGQTITVSGVGFAANLKGIAVGQCKVGYTGPADCNLAGGATFRNSDGSGSIGTVTIKLATSFGGIDCTKTECVIAAAPLPTSSDAATVKANTASVPITFGAAPATTPAATTPVATTQTATTPAATTPEVTTAAGGDLPKTGAGDSLPVLVLAGSALLLSGLALSLLVPTQRRRLGAAG
ncbi:neocarzinostatin apoprotein domain-containing protein [Nocardioides sp.]|uniref:neocarzinostatin apoprotein domain-containing protein n=1 Tax=Nocardioides sp. TaxID=35761 RepID=UPI003563C89A